MQSIFFRICLNRHIYQRETFTTNSSSSHSVVTLNKKKGPGISGAGWKPGEFGWQFFKLTKPEDKAVYMAVQLLQSLTNTLRGITQADIEKVNRIIQRNVLDKDCDDYYIDHQSCVALPYRAGDPERRICNAFFRDLFWYVVSDPEIVILGGNDNDSRGPTDYYWSVCDDIPVWEALSGCSESVVTKVSDKTWKLEYCTQNGEWRSMDTVFPECVIALPSLGCIPPEEVSKKDSPHDRSKQKYTNGCVFRRHKKVQTSR